MSATALKPSEPCCYCGAAWEEARGGYAHVCAPPAARHVTLAESLAAHREREANTSRRRKRASKPRVKLGEVYGGLPVKWRPGCGR